MSTYTNSCRLSSRRQVNAVPHVDIVSIYQDRSMVAENSVTASSSPDTNDSPQSFSPIRSRPHDQVSSVLPLDSAHIMWIRHFCNVVKEPMNRADIHDPAPGEPATGRLDLSAFVRHLYDNRLSVMDGAETEDTRINSAKENQPIDLATCIQPVEAPTSAPEPSAKLLKTEDSSCADRTHPAPEEGAVKTTTPMPYPPSPKTSNSRFKERWDIDVTIPIFLPDHDKPLSPLSPSKSSATKPQRKSERTSAPLTLLRQASRVRSQSMSNIRGLMRSLSTSNRVQERSVSNDEIESKISPAAKAALQLDTQQLIKSTAQQQQTVVDNAKLSRKISHLLSRRPTKTTNLQEKGASNKLTRAEVIRRTIIYVPSDDDQSASSGQDDKPSSPSSVYPAPVVPQRSIKRKGDQKSGPGIPKPLDGLELREMSDGSIIWELVNHNPPSSTVSYQDTLHSAPPVPQRSPRRRAATTTSDCPPPIPPRYRPVRPSEHVDIYYAPEMTLPSLLQIITESQYNIPIEEQLDQAMRDFTNM
ncbi:uncharacterized protein BYT42DRAFT_409229 [Radiomyces spectabilis]|uniref:uncharacterized protein n=1 Tax=Radiomyces spectabilis TaxID=64574 RepID=UPI00221FB17B|nr:uncharacterized protein BYT42DRAFT_409229 [Radiomyces spectabilis]KAI8374512.1 hypothetical protein BYT42DRAFT_409229 [Radiomyces spectabilis]